MKISARAQNRIEKIDFLHLQSPGFQQHAILECGIKDGGLLAWALISKILKNVVKVVTAVLREIFDETSYDRFLQRTHSLRSAKSYREFLREREAIATKRPRCC